MELDGSWKFNTPEVSHRTQMPGTRKQCGTTRTGWECYLDIPAGAVGAMFIGPAPARKKYGNCCYMLR